MSASFCLDSDSQHEDVVPRSGGKYVLPYDPTPTREEVMA